MTAKYEGPPEPTMHPFALYRGKRGQETVYFTVLDVIVDDRGLVRGWVHPGDGRGIMLLWDTSATGRAAFSSLSPELVYSPVRWDKESRAFVPREDGSTDALVKALKGAMEDIGKLERRLAALEPKSPSPKK